MTIFEQRESEVRGYSRSFPTTFATASGATLTDIEGRTFIDFFGGAGALNYGHNEPHLTAALTDYIATGGVTHALDMQTEAKAKFLETFERIVLQPRGMDFKVMFPGPTGTNAVEAALKLARKVTGRPNVVSFTNGFHGMTLGSLAVTGNAGKRAGAGVPLHHVIRMPFEGYHGDGRCASCPRSGGSGCCTLVEFERLLTDGSSGIEMPAAVIVETVQAEGGVRPASYTWLRGLRELTRRHGILLIIDDIQVGCGRTGPFFSFDPIGIEPDIVCLSKSLSGLGLPFALTLFRRDLDVWAPGEHNGTFRGFNWAMVTATTALERYWDGDHFRREVEHKAAVAAEMFDDMAHHFGLRHRGRGMIRGLVFDDAEWADAATTAAFERGLLVETAGARGEVVKLLSPLVITEEQLADGMSRLRDAIEATRPATATSLDATAPHPVVTEPSASNRTRVEEAQL